MDIQKLAQKVENYRYHDVKTMEEIQSAMSKVKANFASLDPVQKNNFLNIRDDWNARVDYYSQELKNAQRASSEASHDRYLKNTQKTTQQLGFGELETTTPNFSPSHQTASPLQINESNEEPSPFVTHFKRDQKDKDETFKQTLKSAQENKKESSTQDPAQKEEQDKPKKPRQP